MALQPIQPRRRIFNFTKAGIGALPEGEDLKNCETIHPAYSFLIVNDKISHVYGITREYVSHIIT